MSKKIVRDQNFEHLKKDGYFTMANPELARVYLADYRSFFPEIQMIDGVGEYGVGQILFLPIGYNFVRRTVEHEVEMLSRRLLSVQTAYQKLLNY